MERWLQTLPKHILALIVISIGILLIILFNPPHTLCDSQLSLFKEKQTGFIYLDPKQTFQKSSRFQSLHDQCKGTNSPGGCYEFFSLLRKALDDLGAVPMECSEAVASEGAVRASLFGALDLMVRIAWDSAPPKSYFEKFSWLDVADISLFCRLQQQAINFYGEAAYSSFREPYFSELPGGSALPRAKAWDASLFSENCARYP